MPLSPYTRTLAVLIVVFVAALLLWPGDIAPQHGYFMMGGLPLLVVAFTWSAVREASPFNERSFHRTLPGGDHRALRGALGLHALVFGGILLALLLHAVVLNVRWPGFRYLPSIIFPWLLALCGFTGIVATLRTAGLRWWLPASLALLVLGSASLVLAKGTLQEAPQGSRYPWMQTHYLIQGSFFAPLAAALLYPVFGWLIAFRRRKLAGLLGLVFTTALLPWVFYHGKFLPVTVQDLEAPVCALSATRKPLDGTTGKWPAVADMLEPVGLQEGEFGSIASMGLVWSYGVSDNCLFAELPQEAWWQSRAGAEQREERKQRSAWFGKTGGRIVWGEAGIWEHLSGLLPAHQSFEHFDPKSQDAKLGCFAEAGPGNALWDRPWELKLQGPLRWQGVGTCKAASGGSFRLPQGGVLELQPYIDSGDRIAIRMSCRRATSLIGYGTLSKSVDVQNLMLALVDESGKQAFALGKVQVLAQRRSLTVLTDDLFWHSQPENAGRLSLLRGGTLYVFQPVWTPSRFRTFRLSPP